jgi:hypothetical protein
MRIICFDTESNGLHGDPFCVGAVLIDAAGVESSFIGRCHMVRRPTDWTVKNLLPAIADVPIIYPTSQDLSIAFAWWLADRWNEGGFTLWADWTIPVDAKMIIRTMREANQDVEWVNRPLVVHEVSTVLLALGLDVDLDREAYVRDEMVGREVTKHHPLWDAEVSARVARKALTNIRERLRSG